MFRLWVSVAYCLSYLIIVVLSVMNIKGLINNSLILLNVTILGHLGLSQNIFQAPYRRFFLGLNINNSGSNYAK